MVDSTDIRILNALKTNARMSSSEIAEQIEMSVSAVIERIRKMEKGGIISGYTVQINNKELGMGVSAYVSVNLEHPKYSDGFIKTIKLDSRIIECSNITGDFDYIIKVVTCSTDDLCSLLTMVKSIRGVTLTRTYLVLDTSKNEVVALPDSIQNNAE